MSMASFVGHSSSNVHDDDQTLMTIFACCLMLAMIWTAANWAAAAWVLSSASLEDNFSLHVACTTFFALFGAFLVWAIDRGFLFLADTQPPEKGLLKFLSMASGLGVRVLISLLVSSVTALVVMPVVMESEMSVAALNVLESQEKSRSESFNFSGQQQSLEDASSDVSLIKLDLKRIPVAVQEKQAAALNCWVNRKLNIDALKAKGYSPVEAQKEARPNNCASLDREAKSALNTHQETTQGKLSEALALKQKLGAALVSDKDALARANERANALVTPQMLKTSSTLMQELIENDLGARKKYYGSIALIMLIELLPLVMKLISRQTQAGFQIGVNHISQKLRLLEELADARHHHEVFQAVRNASTPVVAKAMESTETQQQLHEVFVKMVLPTVARINAARMVNEQLVTAEEEAHALARKHASLASAVSAVWGNAINETAQMMENRDLAAT